MREQAIVVLGLPASGKTTYLAALWHLLQARKVDSKLQAHRLRAGEAAHLHDIAKRWLAARQQERTFQTKNRTVAMELKTVGGDEFVLGFPDVAGEAFAQIWEARDCDTDVAASLKAPGVLLFIHSTDINRPNWAAAGFKDTLLRWKMKPEVVYGEKKDIQPRVQARVGQAGQRARRFCGSGGQGPGRSRERAAQVGA